MKIRKRDRSEHISEMNRMVLMAVTLVLEGLNFSTYGNNSATAYYKLDTRSNMDLGCIVPRPVQVVLW